MLKPLYLGPYTFRNMIEGDYLYVDKTKWIYQLVKHPQGVYFLSRPRRFGKSLLISTLKDLFLGHRELFKGLWIEQTDYQWDAYPVLHLNFSLMPIKNAAELEYALQVTLQRIAKQFMITLGEGPYYIQFSELILKLSAKGKVVILIDEYDKPLIDNLSDVKEVKRIRRVLKAFYVIIKAMYENLRFVFLTGVSKFREADKHRTD